MAIRLKYLAVSLIKNRRSIHKKGKQTYTKYDNRDGKGPIIAAPHPSASRFGQGDYADNINEIRNKKTQREIHQNQKGPFRQ